MIKLVAIKMVKQDRLNDVLELTSEMVQHSVKEEGCITYEAYQNEDNNCEIVILEEWVSKEALKKHSNSEYFKRIVPKVNEMCESKQPLRIINKIM